MKSFNFLEDLARAKLATPYANSLKGRSLGPIEGTIISVDDPEGRGRVKVLLDTQVETTWCEVANSVVGKQSPELLNKRVLLSPINGNLHSLRVSGLLDSGAALSIKAPKYEDELPACSPSNLGTIVVQTPKDQSPPRALICMPDGWNVINLRPL